MGLGLCVPLLLFHCNSYVRTGLSAFEVFVPVMFVLPMCLLLLQVLERLSILHFKVEWCLYSAAALATHSRVLC